MKLTPEETERAAKRLVKSTKGGHGVTWEEMNESMREGYRMVVNGLAEQLGDGPNRAAGIKVFMLWMGGED